MKIDELDSLLRIKTRDAILLSRDKWKVRTEPQDTNEGSAITFLGTGGNPEAVIGQIPKTAGFFIHLDKLKLYVDPGIGAPIYCIEAGIDPGALDAIYISHGHTDHYAGAETMIESMCWGMSTKRGMVLAPEEVFNEKKIISRYHQGLAGYGGYKGGPEVVFIQSHKSVDIKGVKLTPIPAYHGGENFGFILAGKTAKIGYTSDTNYIRSYSTPEGLIELDRVGTVMDLETIVDYRRDIKEAYAEVDILIANITCHNSWLHRHITTLGLAHLLKGTKVKLCFITHFNYSCVEPEDIREQMADYVQKASGVDVRAAYDGQVYQIDK